MMEDSPYLLHTSRHHGCALTGMPFILPTKVRARVTSRVVTPKSRAGS